MMILENLDLLSQYCSEFLIHAADVEGLCQGIDEELVKCSIDSTSSLMVADQYHSVGRMGGYSYYVCRRGKR
jgi:hypothetical protein